MTTQKFAFGERVTKIKGSKWTGRVVGFYETALTPIGYAVESENEPGSVQIYPESALAAAPVVPDAGGDGAQFIERRRKVLTDEGARRERALIVASLRERVDDADTLIPDATVHSWLDDIERGDHLPAEGRGDKT
jgi:hypothetical protein